MSHIRDKGPGTKPVTTQFEPLNKRRESKTVGQTFGERRDYATNQAQTPGLLQQVQRGFQSIRDRFSGKKKTSNLEAFSHKDDRFEMGHSGHSPQSVIARKNLIEAGQSVTARVKQPGKNQYTTYLDSVMTFLDGRKGTKKA